MTTGTEEESMRTEEEWRTHVANQLRDGRTRMDNMQTEIQSNTALTATLKADTSELLEILSAGKGGLKVLGWIGTVIKWAGGIAAGLVALYGVWQMIVHGGPPK